MQNIQPFSRVIIDLSKKKNNNNNDQDDKSNNFTQFSS